MNIAQQANTLFATFFIYGDGGQAVWYSATMTLQSVGPTGQPVYGGTLYQTSGTPIGQPYNPALQKYREVGTATLEFGGVANALLRYTVDGVAVARQVERQTFAANSLVGSYIGGLSDVTFGCRDPNRNGLVTTEAGAITVTQSGHQGHDPGAVVQVRGRLRAAGPGGAGGRALRVHEPRDRRRDVPGDAVRAGRHRRHLRRTRFELRIPRQYRRNAHDSVVNVR